MNYYFNLRALWMLLPLLVTVGYAVALGQAPGRRTTWGVRLVLLAAWSGGVYLATRPGMWP